MYDKPTVIESYYAPELYTSANGFQSTFDQFCGHDDSNGRCDDIN